MENFLNFLSNYYIYFLIAAGVLFFALIGLLVDLKKKHDNTESVETSSEVSQDVSVPDPLVTEETSAQGATEDSNPTPPIPVEDTNFVNNEIDNSNVDVESSVTTNEVSIPTPEVDNNSVLDSTPVMNFDTPSEPTSAGAPETVSISEESK